MRYGNQIWTLLAIRLAFFGGPWKNTVCMKDEWSTYWFYFILFFIAGKAYRLKVKETWIQPPCPKTPLGAMGFY